MDLNKAYSQCTTNAQQHTSVSAQFKNDVYTSPHIDMDLNKPYSQCTTNVQQCTSANVKWQDKENDVPNRLARIINYEGGSDFKCYVIQKFQHLEMKLNYVIKQQKQIVDKMSNTVQPEEEQEKIDIFQNQPLKNENELQAMEIKLGNNASYRNEMINLLINFVANLCKIMDKKVHLYCQRDKQSRLVLYPMNKKARCKADKAKLNGSDCWECRQIKQLGRLTRQDIKHSCLCLMRQIVSNEVAVLFSWHGAKKKENFSKLKLCEVIQSVIRNAHASVKDEEISNPLKIWLAHTKERMDRETEKKRGRNKKNQLRNNEPDESEEPEEPEERN